MTVISLILCMVLSFAAVSWADEPGNGMHDASWRGSFGGSIYKYNGSHGCVNMPTGSARKLYNKVSVGTKVIIRK